MVVHLPSGGDEKEVAGGFRLRSATPPAWTRRLPRMLWRMLALGSIARGARAERPDAVHANDVATLIPGYFAARLSRAKLVYDTHEYAVGVPYRKAVWAWLAATIERLLIRRCDAVITVSDGIADRLQARYSLRERPTVVRNVPDLPSPGEAPDLREEMGIGDAPLVLHQGAVADGRGGENLIRAVSFTESAHLLFLGADGAYAERTQGARGPSSTWVAGPTSTRLWPWPSCSRTRRRRTWASRCSRTPARTTASHSRTSSSNTSRRGSPSSSATSPR